MPGVDPIAQLQRWVDDAVASDEPQPLGMTLATATPDGAPSARMVLLRGLDDRGLVFYTNHRSAKGRELAANPRAALVFYWPSLGRQIRVTGPVEPASEEESDAYWAGRPPGSNLSAVASPQSEVIADRDELEAMVAELAARYPEGEVPRPVWWRGSRVVPEVVEFWTQRDNRLHDRLRYTRDGEGWRVERLAP